MQLLPAVSLSALTVFLQGIISFFSPCVLPILPIYFGYLSGQADDGDETSPMKKGRLVSNTFFFILGISFAFFLLALGFTAFGQFFNRHSGLISKIGGGIVILFGLYQLGLFGDSMLMNRERKFHLDAEKLSASPLTAMLMGFTFSFGWTPCVGPALTSALILASSSETAASGFLMVGLYTIGFTLPFMILSFFAEKAMDFFAGKGRLMVILQKVGAVLMIFMGLLMFVGAMSTPGMAADADLPEETTTQTEQADTSSDAAEESAEERPKVKAPAIEMTDREGNPVSLDDFAGKTIFLNFWATWCGPCKSEMPDIQKLYEAYGYNEEDVAVIAVAHPDYYREGPQTEIEAFLDENGYTYPVFFDANATSATAYSLNSFPTTYMIDNEGYVYGYIAGAISYDTMVEIIEMTQTKDYSVK
ncbi:MAG: redoxin domain-containing protein [Clostridia bacterium]|nr:redoxin domain-containing protein [Clostridia bacterium]